jgi:multisubunit Na+/H+ antiporter MnhF subunit
VNAWLLAAAVLLTGALPPCVAVVLRGTPQERVAGLNLATTFTAVLFLLLAQGYGRTGYQDLALVAAVVGPAGTLVFARFLGRRGRDALAPPADGGAGR